MGYPIYHSQYTAAQIEAAIGKGPRVNTAGYWEVWNVGTGAYESTGVGAGVTPPTVVTQVSQMANHGYIYIYNGTETGYTAGYWYYWDGSAWTAGGAYQVAATDTTLSVAGAAADAKATGDAVGELKSAISTMADYNSAPVAIAFPTSNILKYISSSTGTWAQNGTSACGIYEIPETAYSVKIIANDSYGTTIAFLTTDSATIGDVPDYVTGTAGIPVVQGETKEYQIPNGAKYLYVQKKASSGQELTPSSGSFSTYAVPNILDRLDDIEDMFVQEVSENLFNKEDAVYGKYVNAATGSKVTQDDHFYAYFPAVPGTYRFYGDYLLYGSTQVRYIPVFDSEKTYKTYITGSHFGDETGGSWYGIQFTITQQHANSGYAFFALSQRIDNIEKFMVVKDEEYPSEYIPYFPDRTVMQGIYLENGKALGAQENRLYGKTALFFGDSICNGSSAKDNKNGWAGRIGDANLMNWWNYGVNGGTITYTQDHHFIGGDIETARTAYPEADFLILEGGTNDADLGAITMGDYSESDFSGTYDTTTFSGAFEMLIYNAITYFPYAHIGYIVAQKMGTGASAANRKQFFDRAVAICDKWGIPVLNMWTGTRLNPQIGVQWDSAKTNQENIDAGSLYTDGQHLTPSGYDLLTPIIANWMLGI